MTRPPDTWDNQLFGSEGGHRRTILTVRENGEAGCNKSKGPHGHWPTHEHEPSSALPTGAHTKNESARNAAKCGPAQTEVRAGDSRLSVDERSLSPEMNLNLGLCYLLARCWSPDLHSRAIANMNIVHVVKD